MNESSGICCMKNYSLPNQEGYYNINRKRMASTSLSPFKFGFYLLGASHGVISAFLPLYLKQIGLNPGQIGVVMIFRPLGGFCGGLLGPHVLKKFFSEDKIAVIFSCLFISSSFSISLFEPTSRRMDCPLQVMNNFSLERYINSTRMAGNIKYVDRSWMYKADYLWIYMVWISILVFFSDVCFVGVDTIQHGVTMRSLGKEDSKYYGNVRAWGALGVATVTVMAGLWVNSAVLPEKICSSLFISADYHIIFYLFLVFATANLLNASYLFKGSINADPDGGTMMSYDDFKQALLTFKNVSWLLVVFCRSVLFAGTQGFLNWHIENIGGSPALIGAANCVTTITEFFMFFTTPKLIERFGQTKLVAAGIISYTCRFLIFSCISNPVYVLPMEVMEGIMFACVWSSIVSYLSDQVPEDGQTQVQGIIQALQMLGIAVGYPLSGTMTQIFGAPVMFRCFAGLASVAFVFFVLTQILSKQRS